MKKKPLKKIYSSNIISIGPDATVSEAVATMGKNRISCLIVVEGRKPVGIFTERDFVQAVHREEYSGRVRIRGLMSKPVITARSDTDTYEAYNILEKNKIRHLVIVDSEGRLAGIVTQTDIMKSLGAEYFVEIKSISKIMTKNIISVGKDHLLRDLISLMARYSISCIVITENNCPAGIVTERDIVRLVREGRDIENISAGEAMSSPVLTVPADSSIHEAAMIMSNRKIRRLVVVDKRGVIVGLITQHDIIRQIEDRYIEFLKDIIRSKDKVLQKTQKMLSEKIVLENILRSSTDLAIVATDLNHRIVYYNPVAEKIFGYAAEEVVGLKIPALERKAKGFNFNFKAALEQVKTDGEYEYTAERRMKNSTRYIASKISGIWDNSCGLVGFVLMAQDVTERKKLEEELLKTQKLESIGILAGGIAHDFNNLLTGILNCIALSKSNMDDRPKITDSLDMAEKASRLAKDLTQQLFTFAKMGEPARKPAFIPGLIQDSVNLSRANTNTDFMIDIPADLWPVNIDEGQISRVMHNLALNAQEAMPDGGAVNIRAGNVLVNVKDNLPLKEGKYVKIVMEDQGVGVPKTQLQKIFDPYFTTKKKGFKKGMGLGLAICYSIIKNHDGHISVESEVGVGTTFCIYLPSASN